MIVYYLKKDGLQLPQKANARDAGYDVFAATPPKIVGDKLGSGLYKRIDYIEYGTGLFVKPSHLNTASLNWMVSMGHKEKIYCLDLRPRSSLSKYNLLLCNPPGTVDDPYRGEIKIRFKYIIQPEDLTIAHDSYGFQFIGASVKDTCIYKQGDKIVQMLPRKVENIEFIGVDELDDTARGSGGFGSSGV